MRREFVVSLIAMLLGSSVDAAATVCNRPTVTSSTFVTEDALFHWSTAFVVEFVLKCQNDVKDFPLFAEVNGRLIPAAQAQDSNRYQVSWTAEHKDAPSGSYEIHLHTEDGYSAVRKAQRNNEDISRISPLVTISVTHKGSFSGPWIQTPMIAAIVAAAIFYYAYSRRSSLRS